MHPSGLLVTPISSSAAAVRGSLSACSSTSATPKYPHSGCPNVDQASALRLETFAPYRDLAKQSIIGLAMPTIACMLTMSFLTHSNCYILNTPGVLAPHKKLIQTSTTIMKYGWYRTVDIRLMWLQRVHKNIKDAGHGVHYLIKENPHTPAQVYTARPEGKLGPGLPNLDRYGLLLPAHASSHSDASCDNLLSDPISPPPPYQLNRIERVVSAVSQKQVNEALASSRLSIYNKQFIGLTY
ncbi:hypothetical protein JB92DRAFT_3135101 [Gautieria morchelliformis]|nr:hypothetical protein JB92DRAFT_3135101 [Gautieria morchelliformis]